MDKKTFIFPYSRWIQARPVEWFPAPNYTREKYLDIYHTYRTMNLTSGSTYFAPDDPELVNQKNLNVVTMLRFVNSITAKNCMK